MNHDLFHELRHAINGEIKTDLVSRVLYSTDASIYQITPLGVVYPRSIDDLSAIVQIAGKHHMPILARGAGTSLSGQAIGSGLIIDCARYLNKVININPEEHTATVEPGVVLANLNRMAGVYNLQFGPDPASADRATVGGVISNNATGSHSIIYGMAVDHVISVDVVLSDGVQATMTTVTIKEAQRRSEPPGSPSKSIERAIYKTALNIREQYAEDIRNYWPKTWRRTSGYNINYLLPWSPSQPPQWNQGSFLKNHFWENKSNQESRMSGIYPPVPLDSINLAHLVAGSEGTLAVIRRATIRLVPKPTFTILGVLVYTNIEAACDDIPKLLNYNPSAIELIPHSLIELARSIPAYARQIAFLDQPTLSGGEEISLVVVEFSGDDLTFLLQQVKKLRPDVQVCDSQQQQQQIWAIRRVGLGILYSQPGDLKPISFIEDLSVPVECLGEFIREMRRIFTEYNTWGYFYAHASVGCLHIRPLLNLKTSEGVTKLRQISQAAVDLVLKMGGATSGEHGDGLARSEWIERTFGSRILNGFRELKIAADPTGILNPGKIIDPPPMDRNLRFGAGYQAHLWQPALDFSGQGNLLNAIELCNGAGVCRKEEGVMCPSFQVTRDEQFSPRGRANLLKAMSSGLIAENHSQLESVFEAFDLCLGCKGCKAECPSAVDIAKLKIEYLNNYYNRHFFPYHFRPLRDFLFSNIHEVTKLIYPLGPFINILTHNELTKWVSEGLLGIAKRRQMPLFNLRSLHKYPRNLRVENKANGFENVIFLSDVFTEYYQPEIGITAMKVLVQAGCIPTRLKTIGAGRTFLSKGFIKAAQKHARLLVDEIQHIDPSGEIPILGIEPSELYTLRDELPDLLPGDEFVQGMRKRTYLIDEFLIRPRHNNETRIMRVVKGIYERMKTNSTTRKHILLHGHCFQKAQLPSDDGFSVGVQATKEMLETVGYQVDIINAGCCGMAGAFGYEAEHYRISMQIGEQALFPAIRQADIDDIIVVTGYSCQTQIKDGTGRIPIHPITLLC